MLNWVLEGGLLLLRDDLIDDPIGLGLLGGHEVVAVGIVLDRFDRLAGVLGQNAVDLVLGLENMFSANLNVDCLAFGAAHDLVDEDFRIWECQPLARRSGGQQQRSHRRGHANADGRDRRLHELHGVINSHAGADGPARGIDVELDIFLTVFVVKEEHLSDDDVGQVVVNGIAEKNNPVFQQARINIVGALAVPGFFDDRGDEELVVRGSHNVLTLSKLSFFGKGLGVARGGPDNFV